MTSDELTLLLVEDNPTDVRLIEEYLIDSQWEQKSAGGPEVIHASSLSEGIEAQSEKIDLVLLDLNLPDSAGIETVQSMLAASETVPLVVLTGMNDQRLGVKAVEEGAQDYLVKDEVSPELLQRTIRYAIERASQERELRQRNRELAVLNQIVRHDIRNDVSVITGWGTTLEDYVEPGGEEYLSRVIDAADHITQLTETVGDFLKILDGEQDAELRPSDPVRVLRAEIEKARATHSEAEFTIEGEVPDGVTVEANQLLSSVFRNLLNNAVTHNTEDTPQVAISLEVAGDTVQVAVADNGLGIPDDRKETVFGRGQMGLESPGSGIGLHLVDTLVDIYGGEVWVEDNEPTGSVFRIELPRA
jgi:signal transduction histidine kinase